MGAETVNEYGIDIEKGLRNCMGNEAFYKKILSMFLRDKCFACAKEAYESGNREELFKRMHELKGVSGNAALVSLYAAIVPLVELLRRSEEMPPEAKEMFESVEKLYALACEGIEKTVAQG